MKRDVEQSIDPPQGETILEVELTGIQEKYYKAIYEQVLRYHSDLCVRTHLDIPSSTRSADLATHYIEHVALLRRR